MQKPMVSPLPTMHAQSSPRRALEAKMHAYPMQVHEVQKKPLRAL